MKTTRSRFRALFQLSSNFSEASLVSLVFPAFFLEDVAEGRFGVLIFGSGLTILFVVAALFFAEQGKI